MNVPTYPNGVTPEMAEAGAKAFTRAGYGSVRRAGSCAVLSDPVPIGIALAHAFPAMADHMEGGPRDALLHPGPIGGDDLTGCPMTDRGAFLGFVGDVPLVGRIRTAPGFGLRPTLVLPYWHALTVPEPARPDPVRHPRAASTTVMQSVARCHGTLPPDRFHDWLEVGLRMAAGADEPPVLTLRGRRRA